MPGARAHPALLDGVPGVLVTVGGRPVAVLAFTVEDGRIVAIDALGGRRVAGLGLEGFIASQ